MYSVYLAFLLVLLAFLLTLRPSYCYRRSCCRWRHNCCCRRLCCCDCRVFFVGIPTFAGVPVQYAANLRTKLQQGSSWKKNKHESPRFLLSLEWVHPHPPSMATAYKASTCHLDRRKTTRWGNESPNISLLGGGGGGQWRSKFHKFQRQE